MWDDLSELPQCQAQGSNAAAPWECKRCTEGRECLA